MTKANNCVTGGDDEQQQRRSKWTSDRITALRLEPIVLNCFKQSCVKFFVKTSVWMQPDPTSFFSFFFFCFSFVRAKVGQILQGISVCSWSHYTAKRLQQQKETGDTGNLFRRADISVQTQFFVSADKQRKVCMSVEK